MHTSWQSLAGLFLAWAHSTASNPLGPETGDQGLNLPNLPASISNLSKPDIPMAFKVRPMYFHTCTLPNEAFWLNAMVAAQAAARGDFDSTMPLESFSSQRFPQPVIRAVTPPPGVSTTIIRKHMVWGVYLGMLYMWHIGEVGLAVFGLEYGGEELGIIGFGPPQTSPISSESEDLIAGSIPLEQQVLIGLNTQTGAIETTNASTGAADSINSHLLLSWAAMPGNISTTVAIDQPSGLNNTTSVNNQLSSLTNSLSIDLNIYRGEIPNDMVLEILLNTICDVAPRPHDAAIASPWISVDEPGHFQVRATDIRGVPRTEEPYFLYDDVAGAMVIAADWMIGRNEFGAFEGVVKVDGVPVGEVILEHE